MRHSAFFDRLFAKTKVGQLDVAVGVEQNVFGFQVTDAGKSILVTTTVLGSQVREHVPVNDALAMEMFKG